MPARFAPTRLDHEFRAVLATLLLVIAAYLIGSISFAVVVSGAFGLPDPHGYGSGNPGATNVLRTGHRIAAFLTLLGDGLKGFVAVFAAQRVAPMLDAPAMAVAAAALAVFVGHLYPVFHRFSGGKGVSTAAGIVFALHWPLGLALTLVWLVMAFGFGISSLAALTTALLLPLGLYYVKGPSSESLVGVVIALLLFWRHRRNIRQLVSGSERTIGR
jgi:glycerol-3-phosphate acyltransferase PlsY